MEGPGSRCLRNNESRDSTVRKHASVRLKSSVAGNYCPKLYVPCRSPTPRVHAIAFPSKHVSDRTTVSPRKAAEDSGPFFHRFTELYRRSRKRAEHLSHSVVLPGEMLIYKSKNNLNRAVLTINSHTQYQFSKQWRTVSTLASKGPACTTNAQFSVGINLQGCLLENRSDPFIPKCSESNDCIH